MVFNIEIDQSLISEMQDSPSHVSIIPFTGHVKSDLFSGTILPGAADVRFTDPAGCRHACAKYMFRGRDQEDNKCYLYVENSGYFRPEEKGKPHIDSCPLFVTDSPLLKDYLSRPVFRAEVHGTPSGADILIFDITKND